jgi:hypothetical protein
MNKIFKYLVIGIVLIAATITVAAGIMVYRWKSYYIDERIWEGQGYGFEIGQTKDEVLSAAVLQFEDETIRIIYPMRKDGYGPLRVIRINNDRSLYYDDNEWTFYLDDKYFDLLRLTFRSDKLSDMYRHRKLYELP